MPAGMDVSLLNRFQSTLSVRRATQRGRVSGLPDGISIHALRKESDPSDLMASASTSLFQSTLSVRRATGLAQWNTPVQ